MQVELDLPTLESDLHRVWGRRLAGCWWQYNDEYLEGRLRTPSIRIGASESKLGEWDGLRREITVSAHHILRDDWVSVLDTLRHEMAHQYVQEVLGVVDETAHGRAFFQACERLRCAPDATTNTAELRGAGPDQTLLRIEKLLSLAESPNENEAQAAMQKARRLLVKYNVDVVELDRSRNFGSRVLGDVKARHTSAELWIGAILTRFFFVESLWSQSYNAVSDRRGTVLQVYGTPENLDMATYVFNYLEGLLPILWVDYRTARGLSDNRERQRYFAGVMEGFHSKLDAQERTMVQSEALVWKGDPQLHRFFRYHNPRVVTRYGGVVARTKTYEDGISEGRQVSIKRPVEAGASGEIRLLSD